MLRRGLERLRRLDPAAEPEPALLTQLVNGWGNSWSAKPEYLAAVSRHAATVEAPILECGCGLTTVMLGVMAGPRDLEVWSLEHDRAWIEAVERSLRHDELADVKLVETGLRDYKRFDWYDVSGIELPDDFGLVVCDGPPSTTRGGRYGLVPVMRARLRPGAVVLLDDAARPGEHDILTRWAQELGADFEIRGIEKPYAELVIPRGLQGS